MHCPWKRWSVTNQCRHHFSLFEFLHELWYDLPNFDFNHSSVSSWRWWCNSCVDLTQDSGTTVFGDAEAAQDLQNNLSAHYKKRASYPTTDSEKTSRQNICDKPLTIYRGLSTLICIFSELFDKTVLFCRYFIGKLHRNIQPIEFLGSLSKMFVGVFSEIIIFLGVKCYRSYLPKLLRKLSEFWQPFPRRYMQIPSSENRWKLLNSYPQLKIVGKASKSLTEFVSLSSESEIVFSALIFWKSRLKVGVLDYEEKQINISLSKSYYIKK